MNYYIGHQENDKFFREKKVLLDTRKKWVLKLFQERPIAVTEDESVLVRDLRQKMGAVMTFGDALFDFCRARSRLKLYS